MNKKIDERIPREIGKGALPDHPAVKTPWEKLISFHDSYHFALKHISMMDANFLQVLRIIIPDYETRANLMCENTKDKFIGIFGGSYGKTAAKGWNIFPFMLGNFSGGLNGDVGDEYMLMCGRVNDFGSDRVEKELDVCYWDIIGSEICRATTVGLEAISGAQSRSTEQAGQNLDFNMVESRGCGDLHCRIVAENREKFPMPEHKIWESFGPIATDDQIKYTPEEEMVSESMFFRNECDYQYCSGTCTKLDAAQSYVSGVPNPFFPTYVQPSLTKMIQDGKLDENFLTHLIKCLFEACGKTAFRDFYAIKGLRDWLGVPNDVNDGRMLGAYIEVLCQIMRIPYEIEAFNKDEVIYRIDRNNKLFKNNLIANAYISMWYGMSKTLISAQWAAWEEPADADEGILRLKIAKKIDKFC